MDCQNAPWSRLGWSPTLSSAVGAWSIYIEGGLPLSPPPVQPPHPLTSWTIKKHLEKSPFFLMCFGSLLVYFIFCGWDGVEEGGGGLRKQPSSVSPLTQPLRRRKGFLLRSKRPRDSFSSRKLIGLHVCVYWKRKQQTQRTKEIQRGRNVSV